MPVQRGDIVWHDFAHAGGLQKTRPALVVQNDVANAYSTRTILAAIREERDKHLPVLVSVPQGIGGLKKDSVVDCGVLTTAYQVGLGKPLGRLPAEYMARVDAALLKSLLPRR